MDDLGTTPLLVRKQGLNSSSVIELRSSFAFFFGTFTFAFLICLVRSGRRVSVATDGLPGARRLGDRLLE
jgi:hypothetical protein